MKPVISILAALSLAAPAMAQEGPRGGKFWETVDTNKDEVITKAEWNAAGRQPEGFALMDGNKDGKVTREEGRAAMQKMMERRAMGQ